MITGLVINALKSQIKNILVKEANILLGSKLLNLQNKGNAILNKITEINNIDILLFNRLKTIREKEVTRYLQKRFHLDKKDINNITKNIKQTKKAVELSKSDLFKEAIRKAEKEAIKKLGLKKGFTIKDLKNKLIDFYSDSTIDYNLLVQATLRELQGEMDYKFHGLSKARFRAIGRKPGPLWLYPIPVEIEKLYDPNIQYKPHQVSALEALVKDATGELEHADSDDLMIDYGRDFEFIDSQKAHKLLEKLVRDVKTILRNKK